MAKARTQRIPALATGYARAGGDRMDVGVPITTEELVKLRAARRSVDNGDGGSRGSRGSGSAGKRPVGATDPAFGKRARSAPADSDLEQVLRTLDALEPFVKERENENNAAYDNNAWPEWRLKPREEGRDERKLDNDMGPLKLLSGDDPRLREQGAVFVSYEELALAGNNEVDVSLVKDALVKGNRESVTLDFARRHAAALLNTVPCDGGSYRLTPMQRMATALMLRSNSDREVYLHIKRPNSPWHKIRSYVLEPERVLKFMVNNLSVAAGKTWETVYATMRFVATHDAWRETQEAFQRDKTVGRPMSDLGLVKMPSPDCQLKVCRVVIALVPPPVMAQWAETSQKLAKTHQPSEQWHTWSGTSPLVRKSAKKERVDRTLVQAIKLTEETNRALFWVMEACSRSSQMSTRTAPLHAIPFRIIDEGTGNKPTECRSHDPESPCLKTIICNATLKQLSRYTSSQPTHPLRKALEGRELSLAYKTHCAIMALCSVPSWLRLATAQSLAPLMPQGVLKISMRVRVCSLAGRIYQSDMIISSTDDLIKGMVLHECARDMSTPELDAITARCHAILNRTDAAASIADSLQSAIQATQEDREALPPAVTGTPEQPLTQEQLNSNADLFRQQRALSKMGRLFNQLKEAICTDPPPECPVTLDAIAPENVCILRCCGVIIDRTIMGELRNKCPACRAAIDGGVASASQIAGTVVKAAPPPPPTPEEAAAEAAAVGNVDALVDACKTAGGENCNSGMDAVIKAIQLAMRYKPKGIRILLCCSVHGDRHTDNHATNEARHTAKTRELIMAAVPALTSALTIGKGGTALNDYLKEDDTNRLLVINTADGSTTMAGLNLQNSDLLLFDRLNTYYSCDTARLVQSIGRIMRAQKRTPEQRVADARFYRKHGRSVHAPKLLVFIDKAPDRS